MTGLEHALERAIVICATRPTVFRYFTDPRRFADWWGAGSSIEGRPGGSLRIRYPNGVTASGTVLEVVTDERVVFTYGYDDPAKPIPPGGSRVTVTLEDRPGGTLLTLRHELHDAATRDQHVPGWGYQLALFANVAARDQLADLAGTVDRYFAAWSEPDATRRQEAIRGVTTEGVTFKDAFGCTVGRDELLAHVAASQLHMPGIRLAMPRTCSLSSPGESSSSSRRVPLALRSIAGKIRRSASSRLSVSSLLPVPLNSS